METFYGQSKPRGLVLFFKHNGITSNVRFYQGHTKPLCQSAALVSYQVFWFIVADKFALSIKHRAAITRQVGHFNLTFSVSNNRVAGGLYPPAPTPPIMRLRNERFIPECRTTQMKFYPNVT